MAENTIVGSVAGIWRFPVKSMKGERLEQREFTERGHLPRKDATMKRI